MRAVINMSVQVFKYFCSVEYRFDSKSLELQKQKKITA